MPTAKFLEIFPNVRSSKLDNIISFGNKPQKVEFPRRFAYTPMSGLLSLPERPTEVVSRWIADKGLPYRREVPINGFRVDFVADWDHVLVILEVDEKQHLAYEVQREITRTNAILNGLHELYQADPKRKPILVVRFNPDSYLRVEETKNPNLDRRLTVLGLFIDQYKPKSSQPIQYAYFCYNTDLLCNLSCPFLAGNERLQLIAFPILADPDAVTQLPEKQLKSQLRAQRKLKNIDPRDQYIETLQQEIKAKDESAMKLREEVKAAKRKVAESEAEARAPKERKSNTAPVYVAPYVKGRTESLKTPKEGYGGIYIKHRKNQRPAYSVQYRAGGKLLCHHIPNGLFGEDATKARIVQILRQQASSLGLTNHAIDRSLTRMNLANA